jgi:hypothetical protein
VELSCFAASTVAEHSGYSSPSTAAVTDLSSEGYTRYEFTVIPLSLIWFGGKNGVRFAWIIRNSKDEESGTPDRKNGVRFALAAVPVS